MIVKIISVLFLSSIPFIEGISYCCPGPNVLGPNNTCSDGTLKKTLNCEDSYILRLTDQTATFEHDGDNNLILDHKEIIHPDRYCLTTSLAKKTDIYIICTPDEQFEDRFEEVSREICTIFMFISVFFIFLTVAVYLIIPDLLYLQDVCILHSIVGLAIGYISLSIINLSYFIPEGFCHFLAYSMYFSFLYSFFWLNVICFHIWRQVIQPRCVEHVKIWKILYHIYGIGAPVLAVSWLLIMHYGEPSALASIHPGIGLNKCWFKSAREAHIYFNGPMAFLLLINIIFFIWTLIGVWSLSKHCPKTKILKYRLRMYGKLFFVMGITWIFEILSSVLEDQTPKWVWILTDILNALQGLIIFLVLVVFRKTIKRSLANRRVCKWRFPAQWKNEKDSECEELDEGINLSNDIPIKPNVYN